MVAGADESEAQVPGLAFGDLAALELALGDRRQVVFAAQVLEDGARLAQLDVVVEPVGKLFFPPRARP